MDNWPATAVLDFNLIESPLMAIKTAHIIGLGLSGIAAAKLLIKQGWQVFASDDRDDLTSTAEIEQLQQDGLEVMLGGHHQAIKRSADLVIVSPGVPLDAEVIQVRRSEGVELIGEAELGWRNCKGKLVAITGSNGKSTTTALLGEIFNQTGQPSFVCGNIGLPICEIAHQTTDDSLIAMEVSSYQLMSIKDFRPSVSILLNMSPDHLEYHSSFEKYCAAKARIWMNQTSSDYLVYNSDDEVVSQLVKSAQLSKVGFSHKSENDKSDHNMIHARVSDSLDAEVSIKEYKLPGRHNRMNALAAMFAALLIGVSSEHVEAGVLAFKGLPHRLEKVRELRDVVYYNDSKATNPESSICALEAMDRPVVLVAGGLSKGEGFKMMRDLIAEKITHLVLIGDCADEIEADIGDLCIVHRTGRLWESVSLSAELANSGDAVLFSPMAASFDMFKNFEDRGNQFKELVHKLT